MTNYYIPIIYIISVDGQASPRLFIAPEICHEKSPIQKMLRKFNIGENLIPLKCWDGLPVFATDDLLMCTLT